MEDGIKRNNLDLIRVKGLQFSKGDIWSIYIEIFSRVVENIKYFRILTRIKRNGCVHISYWNCKILKTERSLNQREKEYNTEEEILRLTVTSKQRRKKIIGTFKELKEKDYQSRIVHPMKASFNNAK